MNAPASPASGSLLNRHFGPGEKARRFLSPGRINLVGAHTDYNGGPVLPAAIDLGVTMEIRPSKDGQIRIVSEGYGEPLVVEDSQELLTGTFPTWAQYTLGIVETLKGRNLTPPAVEVAIESGLPVGAGLSSSAAITVGMAGAVRILGGADPNDEAERDLWAQVAHEVETEQVGVQCGRMDHIAVARARRDHALLIDFGTDSMRAVPVPADRLAVVAFDSGTRHQLKDSPYNVRVSECRSALQKLRELGLVINHLASLTRENLDRFGGALSEAEHRRARHVVDESARVRACATALEAGDLDKVGELMSASHGSCRLDFQTCTERLDRLHRLALEGQGVWGARVMGAGFGGCVVALVRPEACEETIQRVSRGFERSFGEPTRAWPLRIGEGFREVFVE